MQESGWESPLDTAIREAYTQQNMSMDAIAEGYGISRADVKRRLLLMGVRIRGKGEMLRGKKRPAEVCQRISAALKGKPLAPARGRRHSEVMKGKLIREKNPNWHGGVKHDSCGYAMVLIPDHPRANNMGYVRQHILVMEEILDRPVLPEEEVHHINGIKDDNRPENLMLFKNGTDHRQWHAFFRRRQRLEQQTGT